MRGVGGYNPPPPIIKTSQYNPQDPHGWGPRRSQRSAHQRSHHAAGRSGQTTIIKMTCLTHVAQNLPPLPGWCSAKPGSGSLGCTHTLFLEKMISPSSSPLEPPVPELKVRRSEAFEEARRSSRPRDISPSAQTLCPFSGGGGVETHDQVLPTQLQGFLQNIHRASADFTLFPSALFRYPDVLEHSAFLINYI